MGSGFFELEHVDTDGAIQEAASRVDGHTRAGFLRKAGIGLGAVVGGGALLGALPSLAFGCGNDGHRHPELRAHARVPRGGVLRRGRHEGRAVGRDEGVRPGRRRSRGRARRALKGALGSHAVAKPKFDFKGTTANQAKFQATSEVLEYTGVSAYLGQVGNISSKKVLACRRLDPAGGGVARGVDRRHPPSRRKPYPAPSAFAVGKSKAQILAAVKGTGFIVG